MGYCAVKYKELPEVCKSCEFRDSNSDNYEYDGTYWNYCTKGLYLPTKKNSCKVKNRLLRKGGES